MSDSGVPELRDEIAGASSAWSGPNERTASVDAALVRVVRALDATALHHEGKRPKRVEIVVESGAQSLLEFEIGNDGRWTLEEGAWVDEGRVQRSRLLRPVIRGIARGSRPDFVTALDALVRDVEVACAARIAIDTENDPAVPPVPGQSVEQLLATVFPGLSRDDRAALFAVTATLEMGAGTTVFVEGTTGDEMLFLLGGTVRGRHPQRSRPPRTGFRGRRTVAAHRQAPRRDRAGDHRRGRARAARRRPRFVAGVGRRRARHQEDRLTRASSRRTRLVSDRQRHRHHRGSVDRRIGERVRCISNELFDTATTNGRPRSTA